MTWAGKQGFQKRIAEDSFLVDGVGAMGTSHVERKLAYVEVVLSGHMVPQFSPVVSNFTQTSDILKNIDLNVLGCLPDNAVFIGYERKSLTNQCLCSE
jgi:carboxypeptidase C (cathepsin A)